MITSERKIFKMKKKEAHQDFVEMESCIYKEDEFIRCIQKKSSSYGREKQQFMGSGQGD